MIGAVGRKRAKGSGDKGRRRDSGAAPSSSSTEIQPARRALQPVVIDASTLETWSGSHWGLGWGESAALGLSSVWRAVTVLADAVAGRQWSEWRGNQRLEPSRLVRRPAARLTRRQWTWRVVASLALYNQAPCWMIGGTDDEGVPWSLFPIPPDAVQPREPIDELGIRPVASYNIGREQVSADELVIIRRAELPSIAPHHAALLRLARRVFAQAIAADVGATHYWQNGGSPTVVLTSDQELTRDQADAIGDRWIESRSSAGPGRPAVLGKGAHAEAFGSDPTKESSVEARRELVADVGRLFGLPTRLMNAPTGDSRTYATTEADSLDLIRYTLGGYADPIADAISDLLPGDPILGRRCQIDLDELTVPELGARIGAYVEAVGAKLMTIDEARAALHLPPMPAAEGSADPVPSPVAGSAELPAPGPDARAQLAEDTRDSVPAAPGAVLAALEGS